MSSHTFGFLIVLISCVAALPVAFWFRTVPHGWAVTLGTVVFISVVLTLTINMALNRR